MSELSRRSLVAGASALPALAISASVATSPAVPAPAIAETAPADPVIELAARAVKAYRAYGEACRAFSPLDEKMIAWRKANPCPSCAPETIAEKRAVENWRWRESIAENACGFQTAADACSATAATEYRLTQKLIETRPQTLPGIVAKARALMIVDEDEFRGSYATSVRELVEHFDDVVRSSSNQPEPAA